MSKISISQAMQSVEICKVITPSFLVIKKLYEDSSELNSFQKFEGHLQNEVFEKLKKERHVNKIIPPVGENVVVYTNNIWCRGIIRKLIENHAENEAEIFLKDYGTVIEAAASIIFHLPNNPYTGNNIPSQAKNILLDDVFPVKLKLAVDNTKCSVVLKEFEAKKFSEKAYGFVNDLKKANPSCQYFGSFDSNEPLHGQLFIEMNSSVKTVLKEYGDEEMHNSICSLSDLLVTYKFAKYRDEIHRAANSYEVMKSFAENQKCGTEEDVFSITFDTKSTVRFPKFESLVMDSGLKFAIEKDESNSKEDSELKIKKPPNFIKSLKNAMSSSDYSSSSDTNNQHSMDAKSQAINNSSSEGLKTEFVRPNSAVAGKGRGLLRLREAARSSSSENVPLIPTNSQKLMCDQSSDVISAFNDIPSVDLYKSKSVLSQSYSNRSPISVRRDECSDSKEKDNESDINESVAISVSEMFASMTTATRFLNAELSSSRRKMITEGNALRKKDDGMQLKTADQCTTVKSRNSVKRCYRSAKSKTSKNSLSRGSLSSRNQDDISEKEKSFSESKMSDQKSNSIMHSQIMAAKYIPYHSIAKNYRVYSGGSVALEPNCALINKEKLEACINDQVVRILVRNNEISSEEKKARNPLISRLQAFSWKAIAMKDAKGCFLIASERSGKSLGYIIPLVSNLVEASDNTKKKKLSCVLGPLMIVICPGWESVQEAEHLIRTSVPQGLLKIVAAWGGVGAKEEENSKMKLLSGCDILITTVPCFLRFFKGSSDDSSEEESLPLISMGKCCYLVFEDLELNNNMQVVYKVIHMWMKESSHNVRNSEQLIVTSSVWSTEMKNLLSIVSQKFMFPYRVIISSYLESAVAVRVPNIIHHTQENPLKIAAHIMSKHKEEKSILFIDQMESARELQKLLKKIAIPSKIVNYLDLMYKIEDVFWQWKKSLCTVLIICENLSESTSKNPMHECDIRDASVIVHVTIPSLKAFGQRYSFLLDYFPTNLNETPKVVSHVIVSDAIVRQYPYVVKELQRMECPVSDELIQIMNQGIQSSETLNNMALCYWIKAIGKCNLANCQWRHTLNSSDVTFHLPTEGTVKFVLLDLINASRLMIRMTSYCDKHNQNKVDVTNFYNLTFIKLQDYYNDVDRQVPLNDVALGNYCGVFHSEMWVRAKILKYKIEDSVSCLLIDEGISVCKSKDALYVLPDAFRSMPPFAVEVYLCNIRPVDGDVTWTIMAKNCSSAFLKDSESTICFQGKVMFAFGSTLWLSPVNEVISIGKELVSKQSLRSKLISLKLGENNPSHSKHLQKLYDAIGINKHAAKGNSWVNVYKKALTLIKNVDCDEPMISSNQDSCMGSDNPISNSTNNSMSQNSDADQSSSMESLVSDSCENLDSDTHTLKSETNRRISSSTTISDHDKLQSNSRVSDELLIQFSDCEEKVPLITKSESTNLVRETTDLLLTPLVDESSRPMANESDSASMPLDNVTTSTTLALSNENSNASLGKQEITDLSASKVVDSFSETLAASLLTSQSTDLIVENTKIPELVDLKNIEESCSVERHKAVNTTETSLNVINNELNSVDLMQNNLNCSEKLQIIDAINVLKNDSNVTLNDSDLELFINDDLLSDDDRSVENDKSLPWDETLKVDDYLEVDLQEIVSPLWFYVTKTSNDKKLTSLDDEINEVAPTLLTCESEVGAVCLVLANDGRYYRGEIIEISETICSVFSIDYGETFNVPKNNIFPCSLPLYERLPPQALKCSLSGMPENGIEMLTELMNDIVDSSAFWMLRVKEIQFSGLNLENYIVDLYYLSGLGFKSLHEELLEAFKKELPDSKSIKNQSSQSSGHKNSDFQDPHIDSKETLENPEISYDSSFCSKESNKSLITIVTNNSYKEKDLTSIDLVSSLPNVECKPSCTKYVDSGTGACDKNPKEEVLSSLSVLPDEINVNSTVIGESRSVHHKEIDVNDSTRINESIDSINSIEDLMLDNLVSFLQPSSSPLNTPDPKCKQMDAFENVSSPIIQPILEVCSSLAEDDLNEKKKVLRLSDLSDGSMTKELEPPPLDSVESFVNIRHPQVLWSQKKERIFLKLLISDVQQYDYRLKNKSICFLTKSNDDWYILQEELFGRVDPEKSYLSVSAPFSMITLHKEKEEENWPRVFGRVGRSPWLKYDFSALENESDSDSNSNYSLQMSHPSLEQGADGQLDLPVPREFYSYSSSQTDEELNLSDDNLLNFG